MLGLLTAVHVLVALFLILVVLLQSARGTDLAGAFGGMGSQTAFGPRGTATFLSKTTAVLAAIFMVTSISLAILSNRSRGGGGSVLRGEKPVAIPQPAVPPARPGSPAPGATTATPSQNVTIIPPPANPPKPSGAAPASTPQPAAPPPQAPSPGGAPPPSSPGQ